MITFLQFLKIILKRILADMNDEFRGTVVIFSTKNCIESMKAAMTLQELEIPFIDVPLDSEPFVSEKYFCITKTRNGNFFFNSINKQ